MQTGKPKEPRIISDVRDVARCILFAKRPTDVLGRVVFLIGAGCSVSAGIPVAATIAQKMVQEAAARVCRGATFAEAVDAYRELVRSAGLSDAGTPKPLAEQTLADVDWHRVYDEMFARFYCTPDDVRDLFGRLVTEAEGAVNWAHLCLGEMVAKQLVSTVLTTNFDQLVLAGMVHAGVLPVLCDGIESLNRIASRPGHPQLVELHGSRHAYRLRNHREEVGEVREDHAAIEALRGLMHEATTVVVVGYAGREEGVMDLLVRAAETYSDKNLYWVQYSKRPEDLSDKARAFLATTRNGGLLIDRDADAFFLELSRELGLGAPSIVADPLASITRVMAQLGKSTIGHTDIRAEIDEADRRIASAKDCLGQVSRDRSSPVVRLRDLRLSGKLTEAYHDSLKSVPEEGDLGDIDTDLLWEAATIATDLAERDAETASSRRAERLWRALAARDLAPLRHLDAERRWGWALFRLGERSSGPETLRESIAVLTEVTACIDREAAPLDWAAAQHGLGTALSSLGLRESGTERQEAAVEAYRAALLEWTRERVPLEWACTQNNLGNALSSLGEREGGTERLESAVEAYRAALLEWTRERVPLDWASTQNNLGTALQSLGVRESGTERLEAALAACHAVLQEWTRERAPLDWAMAQNNLGNVLSSLGLRESGVDRLEAAVIAYRAALQEWTRERVPLQWAATQYNLGLTLTTLGIRTGDRSAWAAAEATLRTALDVVTPETDGYWHGNVSTALANVVALQQAPATEKPKRKPPPPRDP